MYLCQEEYGLFVIPYTLDKELSYTYNSEYLLFLKQEQKVYRQKLLS